jgi:3-dehydroquinate synthase
MSTATRIRVPTTAAYDVLIGTDLLAELPALLGPAVHRVAVLHPPSQRATAASASDLLAEHGLRASAVEVPDGEAAKTAEVAAWCWARLAEHGLTRSDAVVGLGGGSTTDLAGFVAATWLRGVRVVHVPTTLLGMVDAAVGGKSGINTDAGKNLVGAIHEPAGVLCDLRQLTTLPSAQLRSGLAEVVKCGFIADPAILDLVESDPQAATDPGSAVLRELVERAVAVKADVVAADLHEAASDPGQVGREALNYGHTLGHAIEAVEGYRFRHGDAVAIGMVFVAELARRAGRLNDAVAGQHRVVLDALGLPTSYRRGRWPELRDAMALDKKARAERLRFVVLEDVAQPVILEAPDEELLVAAYAAVEASA